MKPLQLIALFLFAAASIEAQTYIQISGEVIRPPDDTIKIECFSDGQLIDRDVFVGKFYNFTLGQMPHYTLKFTSGTKTKYCQVICAMMSTEKIIVDVDFSSGYDAVIYLEKKNNKYFTMLLYDRYRFRESEILRSFSQY